MSREDEVGEVPGAREEQPQSSETESLAAGSVTEGEGVNDEPTQLEERSIVFETRVERATELWESGKEKFRKELFKEAKKDFELGLYHLDFDELSYNFELMDKHREQVDNVRLPLWLNVAGCLLRENRPKEAITYCENVLKHDQRHVKALYRRGRCKELMGELEQALIDYENANELAQDDAEIARKMLSVRKQVRQQQKQVDDLWRGKLQLETKKESLEDASNDSKFSIISFLCGLVTWLLSLVQFWKRSDNITKRD